MSAVSRSAELADALRVAEGALWCEGCALPAIAARFGTPLYVLSSAQLRANVQALQAAFVQCWPHGRVELLPALKANFVLAVWRLLGREGVGCDVFGAHELAAALRAGLPGERISVNGSVKEAELLRAGIEAGAALTLDSERELDLAISAAAQAGRRARVRLRLRPDHARLEQRSDFFPELSIRDAAQLYKPGIEPRAALALGRRALAQPGLELTGLMTHLGRHSADPAVWAEMARGFGETVAELCGAWAWRPRELDLGGGLPSPHDPSSPQRSAAAPLAAYAQATAPALAAALRTGGVDPAGITLQIEPGRSLFADAGVHLARVRHLKRQTRPVPRTWLELDTSEVFLPDLVWEHAHFRPRFASREGAPAIETVEIVGLSCNFDLIARGVPAPRVEIGDVIAFLDTGAYQEAGASNFNLLARPGTVLIDGARARLVKRAETLAEVLARDEPASEWVQL